MAKHTLAVIVFGGHQVSRMEDMMLAIRALDRHLQHIMMHVEDSDPQRHHHDEQQYYCAEGLPVSKLHSLGNLPLYPLVDINDVLIEWSDADILGVDVALAKQELVDESLHFGVL